MTTEFPTKKATPKPISPTREEPLIEALSYIREQLRRIRGGTGDPHDGRGWRRIPRPERDTLNSLEAVAYKALEAWKKTA